MTAAVVFVVVAPVLLRATVQQFVQLVDAIDPGDVSKYLSSDRATSRSRRYTRRFVRSMAFSLRV